MRPDSEICGVVESVGQVAFDPGGFLVLLGTSLKMWVLAHRRGRLYL